MRRAVMVLVGLGLLQATACGQRTAPSTPAAGANPPTPIVHTDTYKLFGGRYTVEIQRHEPGSVHSNIDFSASGATIKREWAELKWEAGGKPQGELVLDAGRLTVNGVARGEISLGSRVVIDPSGGVTVTPGEAPPGRPGAADVVPARKERE